MYRGYQDEMFLGYGYHSDTDYQQIKTLYREYFIGRGWRQTAEREGGWGYPYIEFMSEDYQ